MADEDLVEHPRFRNLFNKMFDARMKETSGKGNDTDKLPRNGNQNKDFVKSPSDTTIYAPALKRNTTGGSKANSPQIIRQSFVVQGDVSSQGDVPNIVSNFVDAVRVEHEQERQQANAVLMERERRRSQDPCFPEGLENAQNRSKNAILEAEKFTASAAKPGMLIDFSQIRVPPGVLNTNQAGAAAVPNNTDNGQNNNNGQHMQIPNIGSGVSDDDFFHLTCHIEPSLIHKIENGEFVELERLLPRDKLGRAGAEENRLEWVQRDGGTFLVPAQKDNKISSFRRWEQAFRAYATIYCGANPQRSREIWQYISVIHTAASSFIWDNVYNYDITFRHLMAFNPQRSWAITYNQMWNLSMKDPLPKGTGQKQSFGFNHFQGSQSSQGSSGRGSSSNANNSNNKRHKPDYCWNFNRGIPCRFGNRCRFIEMCSYCDSPAHGVNICPKAQKKNEHKGGHGHGPNSSGANKEAK